MSGPVAILLCSIGVAVLFYLDRNKSVKNSIALWLPVVWMWIVGSRSVSAWFGMAPEGGLAGTLDGSPMDAAIFGALVACGVVVLLGRRKKTVTYLALIVPIIAYSVYCLLSVTWSPFPVPALKRWTKDVGDVVMVLIIVTDIDPRAAIRRVFSRVGFILFPFSIALIRYTTIGRAWDADGNLAIVGVTDNKNMLGLIAFVISLGTLWNVRLLLMDKGQPNRRRRLTAEGISLLFGLVLLSWAHSSTSLACFVLGSGLMLATHLRAIRTQPSRVHLLCLAIVLAGGLSFLFGGQGEIANALGRQSNLSGRTDMWAAMLPAVSNPLIGVGFDSFWTSPNAEIFHHNLNLLHWYHSEEINEAHNGYIEVYLNLGWIGVCLIATILTTSYWRACRAFRRDTEMGSLILAYLMSGAVYSITEAGFRTMNPMWICLLLVIVSASGVNAGLFGNKKMRNSPLRRGTADASEDLAPQGQPVYTIADTATIRSTHWIGQSVPQRTPWTDR